MSALLALAAVGLAVLASLLPLLQPEPAPQEAPPPDLQARRADLLKGLREIELDFAMGKITADDRDRLRADLEGRAVRVLAALDQQGEREPGA